MHPLFMPRVDDSGDERSYVIPAPLNVVRDLRPTPPYRTAATFVPVNPTLAMDILIHCVYDQQRNVRTWHVAFLAQLMDTGQWREGSPINLVRYKDRLYLVNGQHSLHAIAKSGLEQLLLVQVTEVDAWEKVAEEYAKYDRPLFRKVGDAIRAHGGFEAVGCTAGYANAYMGALPHVMGGFHARVTNMEHPIYQQLRNPELRVLCGKAWADEMRVFLEATRAGASGKHRTAIKRAAVLAVALVTLRYQPEKAQVFWHNVAYDDKLATGDPAKTLSTYLLTTPARIVAPALYTRTVARTWNTFWHGKGLRYIAKSEDSKPMLLEGTPHDGHAVYQYLQPDGAITHDPQAVAA